MKKRNQILVRIIIFITVLIATLTIISACTSTRSLEHRRERKCEKAAFKWGCDFGTDTAYIKETVINTVFKDTTIYIRIPGDTVHDSIPVFIEYTPEGIVVSTKKSTLQTSLATSQAWIDKGKLKHTLVQKDSVYKAQIENAIRITQHFMKESTTKVVSEHYNTKLDRFMINSAKTFYLIIVMAIIAFIVLNKLIYKRGK